ncbi:MAG: twin-arginine translocase subunit TatB [Magnetococcales bacterium]|nr:twin-arginine translocase subunit TatB [Magnetococcales bacterium]NGZ27715.1 twin-arginine translocase subunit TatB [Magnetococcales bacterium]
MLGLGWSEIFIIVVVALLVIGPDKLPEVIRGTAKVFRQIQRMATDVRHSLDAALEEPPPRPSVAPPTEPITAAVRQPLDGQSKRDGTTPPQPKPEPPSQD